MKSNNSEMDNLYMGLNDDDFLNKENIGFNIIFNENSDKEIEDWKNFYDEIEKSLKGFYIESEKVSTINNENSEQDFSCTKETEKKWVFYRELLKVISNHASKLTFFSTNDSKILTIREKELESKMKLLIEQEEDFDQFKKNSLFFSEKNEDIKYLQDNFFREKFDLDFDLADFESSIEKYYNTIIIDELSLEKEELEAKINNFDFSIRSLSSDYYDLLNKLSKELANNVNDEKYVQRRFLLD